MKVQYRYFLIPISMRLNMPMGISVAKMINGAFQIYFLMLASISVFHYARAKIVNYLLVNFDLTNFLLVLLLRKHNQSQERI